MYGSHPIHSPSTSFQLFTDEDSPDKIGIRQLRKVARELGEEMTDEELQAMIDEFDRDQDRHSRWTAPLYHRAHMTHMGPSLQTHMVSAWLVANRLLMPDSLLHDRLTVNRDEFLAIMTADF